MILLFAFGRRMLTVAAILLVVSALLFVALRLLVVDPAAMPPEEVGQAGVTDQPVPVQYAVWLGQVLGGDLGRSSHLRRPVGALLAEALPATIELTLLAMLVAGSLGLAGGLLLFALRGGGDGGEVGDAAAETATTLLMSVPVLLWALLCVLAGGVLLEVVPFIGRLDPELSRPVLTGFLLPDTLLAGDGRAFVSAAQHMVLPVLALGVAFAPAAMRVLRASLIEVYQSGYIQQARLRGVSASDVLLEHALRNAALPTLSLMGAQFGLLLGGALVVEVVFAYPGMGSLLVEAVRNADLAVIQAVGLAYCGVALVVGAAVDGVRLALSPRLRPS